MANYEIVMNVDEWCATQKALVMGIKGSYYSNVYPTNCLYYHGDGVYSADCWNKDKALIWGKGVLPKNKGEYIHKPGLYGLGDWDGNKLMSECTDVSTDFKTVVAGEGLLTQAGDHWGTYVDEFTFDYQGKKYTCNVVESTPIWANGIQGSWVDADGTRREYKGDPKSYGKWYKHGKLSKWIDYLEKKTDDIITIDVPKEIEKLTINFNFK